MRNKGTYTLALVSTGLVIGLAGCGSSSDNGSATVATPTAASSSSDAVEGGGSVPSEAGSKVWDASEVAQALGMKSADADHFTAPDGTKCDIALIMTDAGQVSMYADAGDTVAANPDRTAGVKIVAAQEKTCLAAGNALLANLR